MERLELRRSVLLHFRFRRRKLYVRSSFVIEGGMRSRAFPDGATIDALAMARCVTR